MMTPSSRLKEPPRIPGRFRVLVLMGVVSCSLYVWHSPVIGRMAAFRPQLPGTATFTLLVAIAVVAAASLSYQLVERPLLTRS